MKYDSPENDCVGDYGKIADDVVRKTGKRKNRTGYSGIHLSQSLNKTSRVCVRVHVSFYNAGKTLNVTR